MPLLRKEIIKPARIYPFDSKGKEFPVDINYDRTVRWAAKLQNLFNKGYRLPIAYPSDSEHPHPKDAKPLAPGEQVPKDKDGKPLYEVGGFFTQVEFEKDGTLWLHGDPNTEEDLDKLKKAKVSLQTDEVFTDKDGEVYEDAIVHVLSTDKPIFQKQSEWQTSHGLALSLAMPYTSLDATGVGSPVAIAEPASASNSFKSVLDLLKEFGLELPSDTTPENFVDRLGTALRAVQSYKKEEMGTVDPMEAPEGSQRVRPAPIAMSQPGQPTKLQFAIQKMAEGPNPATQKPWTESEIDKAFEASKPPTLQLSERDQSMIQAAQRTMSDGLVARCKALVDSMVITPQVAADWMERLDDAAIQLAWQTGKKTPVEEMIEMAEKMRPGGAYTGQPLPAQPQEGPQPTYAQLQLSKSLGEGVITHQHPEDWSGPEQKTDEEIAKQTDGILTSMGK